MWQKQAYLRLRITGWSGKSTLPPPCVIVSLWDSSQCHVGEIEKLYLKLLEAQQAMASPDRESLCVLGEREHTESRPPRSLVLHGGGHRETLRRGAEKRIGTQQGPCAHLCVCTHTVALPTKKSERQSHAEGTVGPDQAWLVNRGLQSGEFVLKSPVREQWAWEWTARS